jgi:hypothetical protein
VELLLMAELGQAQSFGGIGGFGLAVQDRRKLTI